MTRPSLANIASASSATAAMARARSSLNCFRSARRLAVTSSEVNSKRLWMIQRESVDHRNVNRTFSATFSDIYLSSEPTWFTAR